MCTCVFALWCGAGWCFLRALLWRSGGAAAAAPVCVCCLERRWSRGDLGAHLCWGAHFCIIICWPHSALPDRYSHCLAAATRWIPPMISFLFFIAVGVFSYCFLSCSLSLVLAHFLSFFSFKTCVIARLHFFSCPGLWVCFSIFSPPPLSLSLSLSPSIS